MCSHPRTGDATDEKIAEKNREKFNELNFLRLNHGLRQRVATQAIFAARWRRDNFKKSHHHRKQKIARVAAALAPLVTKILRMPTSLNTDFGWPTQVEGMQLVGNLQIGHTKGIAPAPRTGFVEKEIQNCVYTSLNFQTCFDLLFLFATENITCCEDSVMVITTAMLY